MSIKQSDIDEVAEILRKCNIKVPVVTKEDKIAFANKKVDWTVEEAMAEFDELLFNELDAA